MDLQKIETDVLVVGSEGAGARAAIAASAAGVEAIITTKGVFGGSGVTLMAPFSCCAAFGHADPRDNPEVHFRDTIIGGKFLNDQRLVEVFTEEAPRRLLELEQFGVKFEKKGDKFVQAAMPGHTYPRALYYKFQTGIQFKRGLRKEVRRRGIKVVEDLFVLDILTNQGQVAGALALDIKKGELIVIAAKAIIIATGGAMELYYPYTDASCDVTGDGYAMALRAGAELMDMEFVQFFPTGLVWPPALLGMVWVGDLRYRLGGHLYNKWGERFMKKIDPARMELSTRDNVSIGIVTEILEGRGSPHGGVYLDVSYLPRNLIENYLAEVFPGHSFRGYNLLEAGLDVRVDAAEVAPVCHFFMGGIRIDESGRTSIPGLLAAGEVAGGVNGANRIEGNALPETQVFGARAGEEATRYVKGAKGVPINLKEVKRLSVPYLDPFKRTKGVTQLEIRKELQRLMWTAAGVVRDGPRLEAAKRELKNLKEQVTSRLVIKSKVRRYNREWFEAVETLNMLLVGEAIIKAATLRRESRGAHFRKDFPKRDDKNWLVNMVSRLKGEEIIVEEAPVALPRLTPDAVTLEAE